MIAVDKAVEEHAQAIWESLTEEVQELIKWARVDLWHGPIPKQDDYPGFIAAVQKIREAFDEVDLDAYLELWSGYVTASPPDDSAGEYVHLDRRTVKVELLGALAEYV